MSDFANTTNGIYILENTNVEIEVGIFTNLTKVLTLLNSEPFRIPFSRYQPIITINKKGDALLSYPKNLGLNLLECKYFIAWSLLHAILPEFVGEGDETPKFYNFPDTNEHFLKRINEILKAPFPDGHNFDKSAYPFFLRKSPFFDQNIKRIGTDSPPQIIQTKYDNSCPVLTDINEDLTDEIKLEYYQNKYTSNPTKIPKEYSVALNDIKEATSPDAIVNFLNNLKIPYKSVAKDATLDEPPVCLTQTTTLKVCKYFKDSDIFLYDTSCSSIRDPAMAYIFGGNKSKKGKSKKGKSKSRSRRRRNKRK